MRLPQPFIRLALTVDVDRLRSEIAQFGPGDWRDHPQGHPGNSALPLVARHGQAHDDGVAGPMAPTPHLARCPYVRQVLAALNAPLGRSRLMRLDAGAEATSHVDANYYWSQRVRVHIPIETTPGVRFLCGDAETHMAPGEVSDFRHLAATQCVESSRGAAHSPGCRHGRQRCILGPDARPGRAPFPGRLCSREGPSADDGNDQLSSRDESLRVQCNLGGLARRCGRSQRRLPIDGGDRGNRCRSTVRCNWTGVRHGLRMATLQKAGPSMPY